MSEEPQTIPEKLKFQLEFMAMMLMTGRVEEAGAAHEKAIGYADELIKQQREEQE